MRWPASWRDPSLIDLLNNSGINCLIFNSSNELAPVVARARKEGLVITPEASPPPGVTVVTGEWPGVKLNDTGATDRASAGPTGAPWVDSNGWAIRLAAALKPGTNAWVSAVPQKPRLFAESYVIGVADAAAHGGRWIVTLDDELAAGIAGRNHEALATWRRLAGAVGFFSSRAAWSGYLPEAVIGVISDFSGKNEFMSHELLNLLARTNQQYKVVPKKEGLEQSFKRLRAVLYTDDEPPAPDLRRRILTFVEAGGTLVTGPNWGAVAAPLAAGGQHPRYAIHVVGKGRVAVAQPDFEDPYIVANDAVVLMSHRYELVRLWNVGAMGSFLTMQPGGRGGVVQLLFYASARFGDASVRIPQRCSSARLWTLDRSESYSVEMEKQRDGTEFHLPSVSQYAAIEFEV